jgi:hypothetical protein
LLILSLLFSNWIYFSLPVAHFFLFKCLFGSHSNEVFVWFLIQCRFRSSLLHVLYRVLSLRGPQGVGRRPVNLWHSPTSLVVVGCPTASRFGYNYMLPTMGVSEDSYRSHLANPNRNQPSLVNHHL